MPQPEPQSTPPPSKAVRLQTRANRSTRDHWTYFAPHRAEIQKLLLPPFHAAGTGRLCVLGAGNCNDIDLRVLCESFADVHLVDIDRAALDSAVRRQGVESSPHVRVYGGVDLTGIAERFAAWETSPPTPAEVRVAAREAVDASLPARVRGPFDVVLSPCLLSQLVGYASDLLGRGHALRREFLVALRTRHLRMLVDLLRPGGSAVLVCDVASSDGVPALGAERKPDLSDLLNRLTYTGRHFDGLAPPAVEAALRSDPLIAPLLGHVQLVAPWLWHLGPRRTFLVYGAVIRRSGGTILLK